MYNNFIAMLIDDEGQGLVEYGLIIMLVSVAAIAGLKLLNGGVGKALGSASTTMSTGT